MENIWNNFKDKKFAVAQFLRANEGYEPLKAFTDCLSVTHKLSFDDAKQLFTDIQFIKNEGISLTMLFATL
jgi:hypothetical protein